MSILQSLLFALVSFVASTAGAICGVGGGVIIKPTLDLFQWAGASTISFLSGCTVLSMSCYSIAKTIAAKEKNVNLKTGTPLAIGAAAGGVVGNQLFHMVKGMFANASTVGGVQAVCLGLITFCTLIYTLTKNHIRTKKVEASGVCLVIGMLLGIMSSFLGIGGGPINLMVLSFFFSMDTKTSAVNSLYIIMFSQFASLATSLITRTVPDVSLITLALMVAGGILGGAAGRFVNKRVDNKAVEKIYICLVVIIIAISCWNAYQLL